MDGRLMGGKFKKGRRNADRFRKKQLAKRFDKQKAPRRSAANPYGERS